MMPRIYFGYCQGKWGQPSGAALMATLLAQTSNWAMGN
jgi:hypothetical protein